MANKRFEDRNPLDCSICMDQLHDPVTIPCGHNYCMDCIKDYWDKHGSRERGYGCPQCRETFTPKPVLNKNTMFAEVVERFKNTLLRDSSPTHLDAPILTECKFCTSQKVCSKCEDCKTYPGYNFNDHTREKHTVIIVSADTQGNICSWHNRVQGVNGQTNQQFTCMQCLQNAHKGHEKTQEHRTPRANKQHRSKSTTGGHGQRKSIRIVHGTGHRHGHSSGHTHGSHAHQNSSGHGVHSHRHSHGAGRRKSRDLNTGLGHDRNWH